jgi:integrase
MPKRRAKGEGTIFHRADGGWAAQITLPNGKRLTKYGKSQALVRDWLTAQRTSIKVGSWTETTDTRLGDFPTAYLRDVVANQVRPGTLDSYTQVAGKHILPELGKMRLTTMRPEHLQRFYTSLMDAGLAAGSVLIVHGVLHQTLQQAMEWGIVPVEGVPDMIAHASDIAR